MTTAMGGGCSNIDFNLLDEEQMQEDMNKENCKVYVVWTIGYNIDYRH